MFMNNWSKYNTEQFCSLYTKWEFQIIYSFIWTEFDIILHWTVELRPRVCGLRITEKSELIEMSPKPSSNRHFDQKVCSSNMLSGQNRLSPASVLCPLFRCAFPLHSSFPLLLFSLSEEDDEDDEEDDEDQKDLDHQPAVGGDWLEVFEDLCVSGLHVQLGVLDISIDPARSTTGHSVRHDLRNRWELCYL